MGIQPQLFEYRVVLPAPITSKLEVWHDLPFFKYGTEKVHHGKASISVTVWVEKNFSITRIF